MTGRTLTWDSRVVVMAPDKLTVAKRREKAGVKSEVVYNRLLSLISHMFHITCLYHSPKGTFVGDEGASVKDVLLGCDRHRKDGGLVQYTVYSVTERMVAYTL